MRSSGGSEPAVDGIDMRKDILQLRFWVQVEGKSRISWLCLAGDQMSYNLQRERGGCDSLAMITV